MNTRDIGREKAFELLRDLDVDPTGMVNGTAALSIATCAFLQGWVYGLQDARDQAELTVIENNDQIALGFAELKRLLKSGPTPILKSKSRG